ncbi:MULTISPECIES: PepSY domain-containing protein [Pseudomonas]|uniref:PepSY domain-containing protein n=1 Tax=Pseudomonas beijingensis TaxID=2954101 RepID=A0ABY9FB12_9PSED|nr:MULTISPECIES: PepSY domain-containing protein [unclassified Pseudomonas]WLG99409.1 PepSY domain-containing protein [Pseudomonas sp. FP2034]WLH44539.1 PepSY domain-containing protein [Pseudomonas sp. FP2262]WLI44494.1 PepSY domain-containing protein [Pseudomonas sp. FP830]
MNRLTAFFIATLMALGTSLAHARDLSADEARKLQDAGTILSFERLNAAALAKHPGATLTETELEEEYGKYIYQVGLHDKKGIEWDVELDATNGKVLKNHQDL